jgi:DNA-binding NtrC family response regulator
MTAATLVGCSLAHRRLLEKLSKIANTDAEILITGPTGVGKELYARFVHSQSTRRNARFVPVNCGALPNELLENEFFGHVGGAFTGARPQSEGLVAEAEGGTLFLDEVDSLSLPSQVKLLRFLQDKQYRRLGETRIRRSDVRFIAATNADLLAGMREGRFREDLFFRLRVIPIEVPPLRERPEDIPVLLSLYVTYYAKAYQLVKICFSEAAQRRLETYAWHGNIRELENCVRYLTCLQLNRAVEPEDLPLLDVEGEKQATQEQSGLTEQSFREAKRELVNRFERIYLEDALRKSNGNIAQAARASGKARRAFFELMRKHGVNPGDFHVDAIFSVEEWGETGHAPSTLSHAVKVRT